MLFVSPGFPSVCFILSASPLFLVFQFLNFPFFPCCSLLLPPISFVLMHFSVPCIIPVYYYFSFTFPCSPLPQHNFISFSLAYFYAPSFPPPFPFPLILPPLTNRKNSSSTYTSILLLFVSHLSIFLMFFPVTMPPS